MNKVKAWLFTQAGSLEAIVYLWSILWGIWVVNPWWSQFRTISAMAMLVEIGDAFLGEGQARYIWGFLPIIVPILLIYTSIWWVPPRKNVKKVLLLVMVFFWGFVMASFLNSNWRHTGAISQLVIVLVYLWIFVRHRVFVRNATHV